MRQDTKVAGLISAIALAVAGLVTGAPPARAATMPNATSAHQNPATLTEQVRQKLETLPWYGIFDDLKFQVNGSEVTLLGEVTSRHGVTRDDAQKAVESIPGVANVINKIEILPPSVMDEQIRRAEYRTIFSQSDLGRYTMGAVPQVHIIVKSGHVKLEGVVIDQQDKQIAGMAANTVPGVFSVENNLIVEG